MPFFEGAQHFVITTAEMNDIGGDYNKTETTTSVSNSDVGNRFIASVVNKGNTETQTPAVSRGNTNTISVHEQHRVNGNIQLSDLPQLQSALQALPGIALPGIPGLPETPAMQSALQLLSVSPNGTTTAFSTGPNLPLLTGGNTSESPNPTSASTATEPQPSVSSISPNVASTSTVAELPSVGDPSSDGLTSATTASATRVAGLPQAATSLVDDSVSKESSPPPPQVETALVVPPQAAAAATAVAEVGPTVGSATIEKNALQTTPMPAAEQPKQRKNIFVTFASIFGSCFNFRT